MSLNVLILQDGDFVAVGLILIRTERQLNLMR